MIYAATGVGGTGIAVDAEDNAYTVNGSYDVAQIPITDNAIQKTVPFRICSGTRAFGFPCSHQNVTKVNATGSRILFCTFVSGSDGEGSMSIAVDSQGDIYLAGTTNSTDYPVTAGALQSQNLAGIPPPPVYHDFFSQGTYSVYPSTAYVTKLARDGSRIVYSTYLGGSRHDAAYRIAVDDAGQASVAMRFQSPEFPGLPVLPRRCLPDRLHDVPVIVRLNARGDAVRSTTVIEGVAPSASVLAAFDRQGDAILVGDGPYVARVTEGAAAGGPLVCMVDAADYVQTASIAPGQLITIYGSGLGADSPAAYDPAAPALPRELGGAAVLFNGVAAPIMYASAEQINFVVPYEIVGQPAVSFELITATGEHVRRTLVVAGASPSLITLGETEYPACGGKMVENSVAAVVLNPDGTRNSCENPTDIGAVVSVFLSGAGAVRPAVTGLINADSLPLSAEVVDRYGNEVRNASGVDWAPLGVWQVAVKLNRPYIGLVGATAVQLVVDGKPVREGMVPVWLR